MYQERFNALKDELLGVLRGADVEFSKPVVMHGVPDMNTGLRTQYYIYGVSGSRIAYREVLAGGELGYLLHLFVKRENVFETFDFEEVARLCDIVQAK